MGWHLCPLSVAESINNIMLDQSISIKLVETDSCLSHLQTGHCYLEAFRDFIPHHITFSINICIKNETNRKHTFKNIVKLDLNSVVHINQNSSLTSGSCNPTAILKLRDYEIVAVTFRWCYDCDWTLQSRPLMSRSDRDTLRLHQCPLTSHFSPTRAVSGDPPRQPWRVQRFITHQPTRFSRSFFYVSSLMLCSADRGQTLDAQKQHCESYHDWRNGAVTPAEENVWGIRETSKSIFFPWPYVMTSALVIFVRCGNGSKLGSC